LNFLDGVSKNYQISTFNKVCAVGVEMFHANGRTDVMKLIDAFCNFASVSKKQSLYRPKIDPEGFGKLRLPDFKTVGKVWW
jgi:hypothetical protein